VKQLVQMMKCPCLMSCWWYLLIWTLVLPELNARNGRMKGVEASADEHDDVHDGVEASQGLVDVLLECHGGG
jgi:hypothetical protein